MVEDVGASLWSTWTDVHLSLNKIQNHEGSFHELVGVIDALCVMITRYASGGWAMNPVDVYDQSGRWAGHVVS